MTEHSDHAKESAPVDRLSAIWRRIYDHKVVQWTVAYVAIAYGLQHGVILASESLEWPNAVARISIVLFALGLPLVATFAWYHGARSSRNFSPAELSILAALLVVGSLVFYVFVRPTQPVSPPVAQEATVTAARTAAATPKGAISVAVLPFLNLSSDKEQEFFSDGMTEEITSALAKVPDLRVVGRTSAFQFKGANKDLRAIGQALSATHLIEGSVRKAGNRVRITAQLIKADDGTHLWAEDYDRDLTDVFAIQEDIARAITTSLHMTLGLKPGENLVSNRNIDTESYDQFLRARGLIVSRNGAGDRDEMLEAGALLEKVVKRNEGYAPAWALLAAADFLAATGTSQTSEAPLDKIRTAENQLRDKGEAAARRAIQLEPDRPFGYSALAILTWSRMRLVEADALFQKVMAVPPEAGTENLAAYAIRLGSAGQSKEALTILERAHAEDPLDPPTIVATVRHRWVVGDDQGAITLAKTLRPVARAPLLAMIFASQGRFRDAAEALGEIASDRDSPAAKVAELLRKYPARSPPEQLPRLPGDLEFVYIYAGAPERVLAVADRQIEIGLLGGAVLSNLWHPSYASLRKTDHFKQVVRKLGFVDYWRAKGWPPQCHPTAGDDFVCS